MYEYDFYTITINYLLPALIPISLFVIAEIFARRKRDERQKAIRNQAYKHAFVVLVSLFLILRQADTYMAAVWNYSSDSFGLEGAASAAVIVAVSVLIVEQIIRGSFFSSESNVGFVLLILITVPYAYYGFKMTVEELYLFSGDPIKEYLLHAFGNMIPLAAICTIIVTATVKHIAFTVQKRRAD